MAADMYSHRRRVFNQAYRCHSPSSINKDHIESSDKILMPLSALDLLTSLRSDYPMLFELRSATTEHVTHCGVLEFTAEEGTICMPTWMMQNLKVQEGHLVRAKSAALPKGTYMKLQPHTTDFIDISNPRAVLEVALRGFSCLTIGDTIMVTYNNRKYYIDIVEAKPASAISVIETDCEVDFAPPLDYKEPERPQGPVRDQEVDQAQVEPKYTPFSGVGRRLDGKCSATLAAEVPLSEATDGGKKSVASTSGSSSSRKSTGSLVFGSKASVSKESKVPSKEREEPEKQEPKCIPFSGVGRRLDGMASKCSTQATFATLAEEVPLSEATGKGNKYIGSSRQATGTLVFGSKASVSKESKVPSKEREEPEKQEPTFQAFTGKEYSLLD